MSTLEIRSRDQHLFQRGDGFRVLKVFRRAPQDPRARQMSLRQRRVERQGQAAVVFRSLQPRALRVELEVDVHRHEGQRGMRQREVRVALDGAGQMCAALRSVSC